MLIDNVPRYEYFLTPDELDTSMFRLAEEHGDVVEVFKIGQTRNGRDLYALKIGDGRDVSLWFGCPHPNEPVGTLVIEYLIERLVEDEELRRELDYTWIFIKAIDRDGLELNSGWLKGPYTILNYAMNYYRPAGNKQVEWTFPIKYKKLVFNDPLPETKALMNIIREYRPSFIYSLHNAGFGGVYYYVSHDVPILYPTYWYYVHETGLPLGLGEPEVPWAKKFGRAIYYMVSTSEYYDFLESLGYEDPQEIIKTGTDSFEYTKRFNPDVFELVTEVPYFYDPRIEDMGGSGHNRRKLILDRIDEEFKLYNWINGIYMEIKDSLLLDNRFKESIEYYLEVLPKALDAERRWALKDESVDREATVAEWLDNEYITKFYWILRLGLFHRLVEAEVDAGNRRLEDIHRVILDKMDEISRVLENGLKYSVIPLDKLIKVQLAAGIYTLLYLKSLRG
jgi:hypothetical protein